MTAPWLAAQIKGTFSIGPGLGWTLDDRDDDDTSAGEAERDEPAWQPVA